MKDVNDKKLLSMGIIPMGFVPEPENNKLTNEELSEKIQAALWLERVGKKEQEHLPPSVLFSSKLFNKKVQFGHDFY